MNPSNLLKHPYDSIFHKMEAEVVARNIMVILSKTGDTFRLLGWKEYKACRLQDGNYGDKEEYRFNKVVGFMTSEHSAKAFSPAWA